MRILHISDTHGYHLRLRNLPEADVIVHSGDITMAGGTDEAVDFMEWFCDLPYARTASSRFDCRPALWVISGGVSNLRLCW